MMNEVIASPPEFVAPICIFLSGEFHPPTRRRCPPLASVKQRRELRRRQHDPPGRARRGPNELALLQPLGQHAQPDTVMPDQLDQPGSPTAEGEKRAAA